MSKRRLYDLLWLVTGLAWALAIVVFMVGIEAADAPPRAGVLWLLGIGLVVAVGGYVLEALRNPYEAAMFSAVVGFVLTILSTAVAIVGRGPHPVATAVAGCAGLATVGSFAYAAWVELAPGKLPDVLRQLSGGRGMFEEEGVQFVVSVTRQAVEAGGVFDVQVVAQNCWDRERTLELRLRPAHRTPVGDDGLLFPPSTELPLPPGGVLALRVPVVVGAKAEGSLGLAPAFRAAGSGGRRIRRRRAPPFEQVAEEARPLLALLGIFVWGGLLNVMVVRPKQEPAITPAIPPPVRTLVWPPGGGGAVVPGAR